MNPRAGNSICKSARGQSSKHLSPNRRASNIETEDSSYFYNPATLELKLHSVVIILQSSATSVCCALNDGRTAEREQLLHHLQSRRVEITAVIKRHHFVTSSKHYLHIDACTIS